MILSSLSYFLGRVLPYFSEVSRFSLSQATKHILSQSSQTKENQRPL